MRARLLRARQGVGPTRSDKVDKMMHERRNTRRMKLKTVAYRTQVNKDINTRYFAMWQALLRRPERRDRNSMLKINRCETRQRLTIAQTGLAASNLGKSAQ